MLLKKVILNNVKSIKHLTIDFEDKTNGWHVLLGMNGCGKSTILKAISLCLLGERQSYSLKENFSNWITKGENKASILLEFSLNKSFDSLANDYNSKVGFHLKIIKSGDLEFTFEAKGKKDRKYPINPEYGWYTAGFGPYRRLGKLESMNIKDFSDGNLENHITLFDTEYALTNGIQWLQNLKFRELENRSSMSSLKEVINFLNNSEFLPDEVKVINVDSENVHFSDGEFHNLNINQLSDGYKSMFALAIEILRQLNNRFVFTNLIKIVGKRKIINAEGIILIDEVDIHLHPKWQSKIGNWFKTYFPNIQFIVTTHSPIICQSADGGKIWKIEHPKSDKISKEVTGQDFQRMVYGNILDSFSTDNFGQETILRSDKSKDYMKRLALLNIKSLQGIATPEELKEIKDIKAILPTSKNDTSTN